MSATNELVAIMVEEIPVIEAQVLITDYEGDEGAEFYCYLKNTMNFLFENLFSNECEPDDFFKPDEDGEIPYLRLAEMIDDLQQFKWARRTWNRMRKVTAGIPPAERLTQLEKSQHPDYKDWCCDNCGYYYKGDKGLQEHQDRDICNERNTLEFCNGVNKKLPAKNYIHIASAMNKLMRRVTENKKQLTEELKEEVIEEEEEIPEEVYKVKLFWLEEGGEWTSYYPYLNQETEEDEEEWTDLEKAEEAFNYAWTYWSREAGEELIGIALVKVKNGDDNSYEIIEERSVDNKDYTQVEVEDEDN